MTIRRCKGGIILHLLVVRSISANERGIALQVAQPGPSLESVGVAPTQPIGICHGFGQAKHTMIRTLTTLDVVGHVGGCLQRETHRPRFFG